MNDIYLKEYKSWEDILCILNDCIEKDLYFEINPENSITLNNYILKLQQENKQLQQRDEVIEEAIEYIKSNEHYESYKIGAVVTGPVPLLNILTKYKGDNNE